MGFKSSQISKSKAKDINDYASRFFLIHCISKFNEENRKKNLFEFFKKLLAYMCLLPKSISQNFEYTVHANGNFL